MRRNSIVFKLFVVTLIVFLFFIATALVFQGIFFERFYSDRKTTDLTASLDTFAELYKTSEWDYGELRNNIRVFNQYNDATMAIVNENRTYVNERAFTFIIETEQGEVIKVYLNNIADENDFYSTEPNYLETVEVVGYRWSKGVNVFKPISIMFNGKTWVDYTDGFEEYELETVTGNLIGMMLPMPEEMQNGLVSSELGMAIEDMHLNKIKEVNQLDQVYSHVYRVSQNSLVSSAYYVDVMKDERKMTIFVLASNQPIQETMKVLEDYYAYVFLGAVILIVFLSILYSVMISKPLIKLNRAAVKMAQLDFSGEIEVDREDEIGGLASSLNTLSRNLGKSLKDLKTANEKLTRDIEKERELENLRKDFVSGISHELKTPLGIMRGYTEGLRDGVFEEDKEYYFDIVLDEINRMDLLIVDMLELSKLESESFKINGTYFDIVHLIKFIGEKLSYHLHEKNLELRISKDDKLPKVYGDELKVEQVLVNFLSNAIRHSDSDNPIDIGLFVEEDHVRCTIKNIGKTIPGHKKDKIWDKFYRVQESRAKKDGGTGLGLAIVKNILKHHDSTFGVTNLSDGVEFFFTLPSSSK